MAGGINKYITGILKFLFILVITSAHLMAGDSGLGTIVIRENHGLDRMLEYVELTLQISDPDNNKIQHLFVSDIHTGRKIPCQSILGPEIPDGKLEVVSLVFPVSINAHEKRQFALMVDRRDESTDTDLNYEGDNLEIRIENKYYTADLTRSDQSEAKSHASGQLRELLIKMDYDITLFRTENRMHWAPNFQKTDQEYYQTIAGWENPGKYNLYTGPYLIRTERQDFAPDHPEILLSATYSFYAGIPFIRFYSSMQIVENIWLKLLRNDEMTMDTLFTHVAFKRPDGKIEDLAFSTRYNRLKEHPIENDAPWLCFYHEEKEYAFGSIRLKYDIDNEWGSKSPVYHPHTKISDGAGGGKYWNRRLIDEQVTFVPRGSSYTEENAYLVFSITGEDKFREINNWAMRLRQPLQVDFYKSEASNTTEN